jgi:hypothetical protein
MPDLKPGYNLIQTRAAGMLRSPALRSSVKNAAPRSGYKPAYDER